MKKISLLLAALLAGLVSVSAQAAVATNTFNVAINLTSACQIKTVPAISFSYASFQVAAATAASSFDILCTNTLPISSITLDLTSVTDADTGLAYTLALGTVPFFGTGVAQTISITGSMPANQAGTCTAATCTNAASTNKTRTLTINY